MPRTLAFLVGLDVLFALAYLATRGVSAWADVVFTQFDLNGEGNLTAFYASAKWLLCGVAAGTGLLVAEVGAQRTEQMVRRSQVVLFVLLACDEVAQFHEYFGHVLDRVLIHRSATMLPVTHGWMVLPVIAIAVVAFVVSRAMATLSPAGSTLFVAGIAVLVTGGGGVELLSNFVPSGGVLPVLQVAAEETLENLGGSIVLVGVMRLNRDRCLMISRGGAATCIVPG